MEQKGEEDRRRDGKTIPENGQDLGFGDFLRAAEDVERYCCNVICGASTTVKVKGLRG